MTDYEKNIARSNLGDVESKFNSLFNKVQNYGRRGAVNDELQKAKKRFDQQTYLTQQQSESLQSAQSQEIYSQTEWTAQKPLDQSKKDFQNLTQQQVISKNYTGTI